MSFLHVLIIDIQNKIHILQLKNLKNMTICQFLRLEYFLIDKGQRGEEK